MKLHLTNLVYEIRQMSLALRATQCRSTNTLFFVGRLRYASGVRI